MPVEIPKNLHCEIRPAQKADLKQILEIENASFSAPWPRSAFVNELEHPFSEVLVVEHRQEQQILAFSICWFVVDEVHLLNIACHPNWRKRGLGRRLMDAIIAKAQEKNSLLVSLEVRVTNHAAIQLYLSYGFIQVGIRPRYYENNEDALVMVLLLRPDDLV